MWPNSNGYPITIGHSIHSDSGIAKKMANFCTHLCRKKTVQQRDVLKRFFAGTYSKQFLCVSESGKTEDSKYHGFSKNGIIFLPEI